MLYIASKRFQKEFIKLPKSIQKKTVTSLEKFIVDPTDRTLKQHSLSGEWKGYFSININGDVRAVYLLVKPDLAQFVAIGSHSELYG